MWKLVKWILFIFGTLSVIGSSLLILRGDEDTWIKDSTGRWIKHGNPSSQPPTR